MKNFKEVINELKKTPRGKSILFFAFYLVFFLIIAVFARVNPGQISKVEEESTVNNTFTVEKINGTNYKYNYDITVDNFIASITGSRMGYEEELTYSFAGDEKSFYKNGIIYYLGGIESTIPNEHMQIVDQVDVLLDSASYESKTDYQSGRKVLRYLISSSTISNLIYNKELDVEEIPNEIVITLNNDRIDEVQFILDSYCKALSICNNKMSIDIKYSDFGNVSSISNSLNN